jgi:hypothetical protein
LLLRDCSLEVVLLTLRPCGLFEELIEQHRVDRVEADGNDLPVRIAHCQVGTHFGYFLGDEAKDLYVGWINVAVVAERDRLRANSASLASPIGSMSCLYRRDARAPEKVTTSLP